LSENFNTIALLFHELLEKFEPWAKNAAAGLSAPIMTVISNCFTLKFKLEQSANAKYLNISPD